VRKKSSRVSASSHGSKRRHGSGRRQYVALNPNAPFSDGVLVGNTFYLAGRIGVDETGNRVPGDIEAEARNVLDGVKMVLQKAGMEMDDLVYLQVFCPDVSLWERFNEIYRSYFNKPTLPARAFIGSGKLLFGAHFEIQGIAVKD